MAALSNEQTTELTKFKNFVTDGVKTKGGYEVDKTAPIEYMLQLNGQLIAKGKVLKVNVPVANPEGGQTLEQKDQVVFWNMNGQAFGNDLLSLVQTVQ